MPARRSSGRVTIGRGSVIGGNVWLLEDVPAGSVVAQPSATVLTARRRGPAPRHAARPRRMMVHPRPAGDSGRKPLVGVLCCNEISDRPIQAVATRFIEPLVRYSGVTVVLVPAVPDALDLLPLVDRLDGLLLTGSRSNVDPARYGGTRAPADDHGDPQRDEVALALAGRMIEAGRPVFGICRGLQELNVLFGGTLTADVRADHHGSAGEGSFAEQFEHRHEIDLIAGGVLAATTAARRLTVNSVHRQGVDRLGRGLRVEAIACDDGLVEAISARPCGGQVLAVNGTPNGMPATTRPAAPSSNSSARRPQRPQPHDRPRWSPCSPLMRMFGPKQHLFATSFLRLFTTAFD